MAKISQLSREQKIELAQALFRRGTEYHDVAMAAFRGAYPNAADEMLRTAVHHVYTDGADAALDFIAAAEMFLQQPDAGWLDYGQTYELLYHVYNWHMFQLLLPEGSQEALDLLDDMQGYMEGDDRKRSLETLSELRDVLGGHRSPPDLG